MIRKRDVLTVRALVEAGVNTKSDEEVSRGGNRKYHAKWREGTQYKVGERIQVNNRLFRCLRKHTAKRGQEPEDTPALWQGIDEVHEGTRHDPIPYDGNMILEKGKYYTQNGKIYLCIRDTGIPVYNTLEELEKLLYVEGATHRGPGHPEGSRPNKH